MDRQLVGSYTAKGGFDNEFDIVKKFNMFRSDHEAKQWLGMMGYVVEKISYLEATHIPTRINREKAISLGISANQFDNDVKYKKADIQVRLSIVVDNIVFTENLSLKKTNITAGYNQVDKRTVGTYSKMWNIPEPVCLTLRQFTGEVKPQLRSSIRDSRRLYLDEIETSRVQELIRFFESNLSLIVSDVLRGRGALSAGWMLVTCHSAEAVTWALRDMNYACNFFSQGGIAVSDRGNLKLGKITMQRKGGTPDPESLQFKIDPRELFG